MFQKVLISHYIEYRRFDIAKRITFGIHMFALSKYLRFIHKFACILRGTSLKLVVAKFLHFLQPVIR